MQFEDCLYEGNALLDDLQMDMLEQTHQEAMQFTACLLRSVSINPPAPISSVESQKGINAVQQCSIKNQKGIHAL